jgi:peptide/nickel transport system substrate-binding protein
MHFMRVALCQRAIVTLAAVGLVVAACGPASQTPGATPGQPQPTATEQPQRGGRIVEGTFADIKTLNPMLSTDAPSSIVSGLIYDGLVGIDPKSGALKPRMGSWTQSPDGLTVNVAVNANANWSDGKPVIAQDFVTVVKAIAMSKKTVRKGSFSDLVGFKDVADGKASEISGLTVDPADPKKFTIKFTRVFCPALNNVLGWSPMPTHVFGKYLTPTSADAIDSAPENNAPPVASGPFKYKEWRQGDQVILSRNDTYWDGAPYVEEFIFKVVADATVIAAQLKTGELNLGAIEPKDLADIEREGRLRIQKFQALSYTYIGWNQRLPMFQDKRLRQALAYGLDTGAVVQSILFGEGTKMVAHHPPVSWAVPTAGLNDYKYDKGKAEDLIKQAGYTKGSDGIYAKDGKKLGFSIVTNAGNKTRESFVQVAAEQYKQIGVNVTPKLDNFQAIVDRLNVGSTEIEAVIIGWALGSEADPHAIWHSSQIPDAAKKTTGFNFVAYSNPTVDKAIEEGRAPSDGNCSQEARKRHYEAFNRQLNEDQPYNFGFSPNTLQVTPTNLMGPDPGPYSLRWNINKWWFKK